MFPYSSRENAVRRVLLPPVLRELGKGGDPAVTSWSRSLIQRLQKPEEDVPGSVPLLQHALHPSTSQAYLNPTALSGSGLCLGASEGLGRAQGFSLVLGMLPTAAAPRRGSPMHTTVLGLLGLEP